MGFTVLRSKASVSNRFVTNNISHHQETICVQHVNGKFRILCFGRQYTVFGDFLRAQNMVRVIEDKIIHK